MSSLVARPRAATCSRISDRTSSRSSSEPCLLRSTMRSNAFWAWPTAVSPESARSFRIPSAFCWVTENQAMPAWR